MTDETVQEDKLEVRDPGSGPPGALPPPVVPSVFVAQLDDEPALP